MKVMPFNIVGKYPNIRKRELQEVMRSHIATPELMKKRAIVQSERRITEPPVKYLPYSINQAKTFLPYGYRRDMPTMSSQLKFDTQRRTKIKPKPEFKTKIDFIITKSKQLNIRKRIGGLFTQLVERK